MAGSLATARNRDGTSQAVPAWRIGASIGSIVFLTMLPVTMMVPVLKEVVAVRFGASSFWTHSFMSINMIGAVLVAPFGGALADWIGRRKPVVICALLANSILLWMMVHAESLVSLMIIRFVEGGAHIIAISALMALSCDWADPKRRGRMMGLIGACLIFGTACGAPLGGRIGQFNPMLVFKLGAGLGLAAALFSAVALRDAPTRARRDGVRGAARLVISDRRLLVPYAYAFIDRFCVGVIVSSFVLFLSEVHGMTPAERGGTLALFLFPFAFLCYPVGRWSDRIGRALPMCVGSVCFGVVFALYGVIPVGWMGWFMLASGVLSAIMFAPNLAMCSDLAPRDQRGSVYAGFHMAGSLGFICGPLVGGTVVALLATPENPAFAFRVAFVVAGTTEVLCALITLPWLLRLHRSQRGTAGATAESPSPE